MSILGAIGGIAGSVLDFFGGQSAAEEQAELQREFAQNGIRWKVEDAKAAGIHPLYALGAQTTAYSPVSVGSTDFATGGQNLGSAIQAMTTPKEKTDGFAKTVQGLTLDKMGLENQILASQLRMINQPGRGPGMPGGSTLIDGQGNSGATILIDGNKIAVGTNSAAQKVEDEYGEVAGEIAGVSKLLNDLHRNTPRGREGKPVLPNLPEELVEYLRKNPPPGGFTHESYGAF